MENQKIEIIKNRPEVLLIAHDAFILKPLIYKLLEFPLDINLISNNTIKEIEHLNSNKYFKHYSIDELLNEKHFFNSLEYIFQLVNLDLQDKNSNTLDRIINQVTEKNLNNIKLQFIIYGNDTIIFSQNNWSDNTDNSDLLKKLIKHKSNNLIFKPRATFLFDLYGPNLLLDDRWELPQYIKSLLQNKTINLNNEGLIPLFPLHIKDAVSAIVKSMFTEASEGKSLLIAGDQEITSINLAYKLRELYLHKYNTLSEIHFKNIDQKKYNFRLNIRLSLLTKIRTSLEILRWKPSISLEEGLSDTLSWFSNQRHSQNLQGGVQKSQHHSQNNKETNKKEQLFKKNKSKSRKHLIKANNYKIKLIYILVTLFVSPFLFYVIFTGVSIYKLYSSLNYLNSGNFTKSVQFAEQASKSLKSLKLQYIKFPGRLLNRISSAKASELENYIEFSIKSSELVKIIALTSLKLSDFKAAVLQEEPVFSLQSLNTIDHELDNLYKILALMQVNFSQGTFSDVEQLQKKYLNNVYLSTKLINDYKSSIEKIKQLLPMIPDLIGLNKKKHYLILLQNNAELRPTGGFIGSYALAVFDKGKLLELKTDDIYTLDGQLKGHVEPPPVIKQYLGEAGWYLRDSNWDPDFPTSARQIEWFFEKESGIKLDGVIAINQIVIQDILKKLGPIELVDYGETINAENLFKTAEYHSEINFFPGSTQKKDFLASISKSLYQKIINANYKQLISLFQSVQDSLNNNQILVYLNSSKEQNLITKMGWGGEIENLQCLDFMEENNCVINYLAIREANVGVNKSNYFVKRNINLEQDIQSFQNINSLHINYQNNSPDNSWPGGVYKNYLRIYINNEAEFTSAKINGQLIQSKDISLTIEHDKRVIGFLIEIPPGEQKTIEVIFKSQGFNQEKDNNNFVTYVQKQSGTDNDPINLSIILAKNISLINSNLPLEKKNYNSWVYNQNFIRNLSLIIDLESTE